MISRPAKLKDWGQLCNLAWEYHAEAATGFPPPNKWIILTSILASRVYSSHSIFVVERDGEILGFITGTCAPNIYCVEHWAAITMIFVRKSSRGGKSALLLLKTFLEWSDKHRAVVLTISFLSGIRGATPHKLLKRLGLKKSGSMYIRLLEEANG